METPGRPALSTRDSWFERIPKVELHLHLEGAIPHAALWEIVRKYGGDPTLHTVEDLAERFTFTSFQHFIEMWVWKNRFLRAPEDFTAIAAAVAADLAAQNIRYAEVFFSPGDYRSRGLTPGCLAEAIRRGLDQCRQVEIALVADLIRDHGPERGARTLAEIDEAREFGIIGIGIGGSEDEFPPEAFAEVYERARALGFHTSAHAGEAAGPASVWGALRALRVDRIGHGTRAVEDPALLDHLAKAAVPVELCPLSNLRTGVVKSLKEHPARRFFDCGIPVSINTDDPKMFGTSLAEEYQALESEQGFSRAELETLVRQGVETSWLPSERKRDLLAEFAREFSSLTEEA
jgi:adenosine deaminase